MEKGAENYAKFQEAVRRAEEAIEVARVRMDEQSLVVDRQEARIIRLEDLVHSLVVEVVSLRTNQGRREEGPTGPTSEDEEGLPEYRSPSSSTNRDAQGPVTTTITFGTGESIPLDRMERLTLIRSAGREAALERFPLVRIPYLERRWCTNPSIGEKPKGAPEGST